MKKILSIIILTLSLSSNSFADDPHLLLKCRFLEDGVKTDIFFEHDLGSTEFEVLEYNKKEIIYTYSNSSNTVRKKVFSLDTNILTLPAFDNQGNQISIEAICNDPNETEREIIESNKSLSWKIKEKYLKPECLYNNGLYVWMSFDNYEEYYTKYLGKVSDDPFNDKKFINFYKNIGLYLNKEIPLNHSFSPSWGSDDALSLSLDLIDCIEQNSTSKVHIDKSHFFISELKNIKLEEAKVLAPHIKNQFISIKEFTINEHTDDGYKDFFSSIYGILDIDGKLIMVPLRN
jgi:hypothetical protein